MSLDQAIADEKQAALERRTTHPQCRTCRWLSRQDKKDQDRIAAFINGREGDLTILHRALQKNGLDVEDRSFQKHVKLHHVYQ